MKPPMLLNTRRDLIEWFKSSSDTRLNTYQQGMGVRALELPGSIRDMSAPELAAFWRVVARALPADAYFVQWGDSQFVLQGIGSGTYTDTYCVLLGSKEWAPVPEGGVVPKLIIERNADGGLRVVEGP